MQKNVRPKNEKYCFGANNQPDLYLANFEALIEKVKRLFFCIERLFLGIWDVLIYVNCELLKNLLSNFPLIKVKICLRLTITRYVSWNNYTCASCQDTVMQKYPTVLT